MASNISEKSAPNSSNEPVEFHSPREKVLSPFRTSLESRVMRSVGSTLERAAWKTCRRIGSQLGLAFFAAGRKRRELAISNVQMALGLNREQAIRVARRSCQNWGMTTCELLHLPGASKAEICEYAAIEGLEHLQEAHALGRGVILLMAHIGNWEIVAARMAQEHPTTAIVRPLSNTSAQNYLSDVRRSTGLGLMSKFGAARPAAKWLRKGHLLCMLPDRHAGDDGVLLPLFGRMTRFEDSVARLAMMNDIPIVPVVGVRREPWLGDGRIEVQISPAFHVPICAREERDQAVKQGTEQVIAALETMVRAHPDQWSWMLRRWRKNDVERVSAPAQGDVSLTFPLAASNAPQTSTRSSS